MIKKMTKYSILAFTPEVTEFLGNLQDLGLMDVTRSNRPFDDSSREKVELAQRYKEILSKLSRYTGKGSADADKTSYDVLLDAENLFCQLDMLAEQHKTLLKEAQDAEMWGTFNSDDITRLKDMGFNPHFYNVKTKKFNSEWEYSYPLMILSESADNTCFVVLESGDGHYDFPVGEMKAPERSVNEIMAEAEDVQASMDAINEHLSSYATLLPDLKKEYNKTLDQFELYSAAETSVKEAEDTLTIMEGFALEENDDKVKEFLDGSGVVYLSAPAKVEDNPPVKLKNNWFAKVFEAIGDLYVLPQYDELDLTPYFAPFYMLFFGLCLGDIGYGLILLIAGIFAVLKVPSLKEYGKLVIWLGIGTVIMPLLNGSFFGLNIYELLHIDFGISGFPFDNMKMFWFAIIFGLVHVVFARIISAIYLMKKDGWQAGLSNIGWALFLVWVALIYAGSQSGQKMVTPIMTYVLCYGGIALILFFSKPVKNIFSRLSGGVIAFYDITGFFGDVLSYIRLFGLGCSGGCLAVVMNALGSQAGNIPYVGWLFCGIILLVGHALVLGLSALGAFVHPMRLTFVEFYKNAGFVGGGKPYKPFVRNNR